jgi:hypothetical protein
MGLLSKSWIESLGGRKFLITLGCGFVTSFLTYTGKINGEVYATVIVLTVGAYITGNAVQKMKAANAPTET